MQVCRHCGWENPEIAAFCTNCGTGLGRDKGNGPRFRALGLTPRAEETPADSIDGGPRAPGPAEQRERRGGRVAGFDQAGEDFERLGQGFPRRGEAPGV